MPINLNVVEPEELKPHILVFGVGGAGGNAVNNMIEDSLEGADFVVANTDAQALALSKTNSRIQIGQNITQGLGAGARPEIGRAAAEESLDDIINYLDGCHMCFITAGMGGGTGTGAAPVIARAARERDILTVGVVTKPFQFEGAHRMRLAEEGINELQQYVDTLIIIPNQNLFRIANERTTFAEAFGMADEVLHSGVRGITDLMVMPGLINLDFADVRSVMNEMGKAMMGTGESEGENRALEAAEAAINNPLLDDISMKGARGVLINITGGMDLTLFEVDEAANRIRSEVDPEANIIIGSTFNEEMGGKMRISIVATGIDADAVVMPRPEVTPVESAKAASIAAVTIPDSATEIAASAPSASEPVEKEDVSETPEPESIVSGMALGKDTGFLAPAPTEVKVEPQTVSFPTSPTPISTQVDAGAQGNGLMRRGLSLIERMKNSVSPSDEEMSVEKTNAPSLMEVPRETSNPVVAEPEIPMGEEAVIVSSSVTAVEPEEPTLFASADGENNVRLSQEDDKLEIPAFLRRQAN